MHTVSGMKIQSFSLKNSNEYLWVYYQAKREHCQDPTSLRLYLLSSSQRWILIWSFELILTTFCCQGYGLCGSHVQLWELDSKEGRAPKNWTFQTMVLGKILKNPLESKEMKPVNLKGDQSWILFGRTLKLQYFGHLMWTAESLEKTLILRKIEGRRRTGWQRMR